MEVQGCSEINGPCLALKFVTDPASPTVSGPPLSASLNSNQASRAVVFSFSHWGAGSSLQVSPFELPESFLHLQLS